MISILLLILHQQISGSIIVLQSRNSYLGFAEDLNYIPTSSVITVLSIATWIFIDDHSSEADNFLDK